MIGVPDVGWVETWVLSVVTGGQYYLHYRLDIAKRLPGHMVERIATCEREG